MKEKLKPICLASSCSSSRLSSFGLLRYDAVALRFTHLWRL